MGFCDHTIERLNQELKRRTRVVRIFPNRAACLRLATALCMEQSEEWLSGRRYLDMDELFVARGEEQPGVAAAGDGRTASLLPPARPGTIGVALPAGGR